MCTNQKEIENHYTHTKLYVKCGKCPACLQEKAAYRVARIKANDSPYTDTLMVTLTYRRYDCPYIMRDEAYEFAGGLRDTLNIYRDTSYRRVRVTSDYDMADIRKDGQVVLGSIDFVDKCNFKGMKDLAHLKGKIGIAFYPDYQDFVERLRNNLKRNFNYYGDFKIYACSEYGTKSLRPHFHLLLWIPKGSQALFRSAIDKSWYFSNISRFPRRVEVAYKAATYVSSYVNCGSDFPKFLKDYAKPKHSYSKGFGCNSPIFQLPEILRRFNKGSLHYSVLKDKSGIPSIVDVPLPAYVIHRFFPKFKGYSRLVTSQILDLSGRLQGLYNAGEFSTPGAKLRSERMILDKVIFPVYYSDIDLYRTAVRLKNAYQRFCENAYKISFSDYMVLHCRIWSLYASEILKLHLLNPDVPLWEKYDNLENVKCMYDHSLLYQLPVGFKPAMLRVTDPNKFYTTQRNTARYFISYHDHIKHRSVGNVIASQNCEEF